MENQNFQVHIGSYDGNLMGFQGTIKSLENIYSFVSSSGSLKVLFNLGKYLFVGGYDEIIRVYDLNKMKEDGQLEGHDGSITALKGYKNFLFSGGEDGNIIVWKVKDWALLHKIEAHSKGVYDIEIHSSGKIMISIGKDQKLIVWNLLNFRKTFTRNFSYEIFKAKFNQTEDVILLMGEKKIHLLKIETNKMLKVLEHEQKIHDFLIYQDKYLLVGDESGEIYIWDLTNEEKNQNSDEENPSSYIKFKAHDKRVKQMKLLKNEKVDLIVTSSSDGMIKIWDILFLVQKNQKISGKQDLGDKVESVFKIDSRERINCLEVNEKKSLENKPENNEEVFEQEEKKIEKPKNKKKTEKIKIKNKKAAPIPISTEKIKGIKNKKIKKKKTEGKINKKIGK